MTTHRQSGHRQAGVSRRGLVQALAAATANLAAPASAQPASVLAQATEADYVRDPSHWGSPQVAALFPGFQHLDMRTRGAIIRLRHGGSGPPLLLLHGNPQTHAMWHLVAPTLAKRFTVVCPDLRGYGFSLKPPATSDHAPYAKVEMAKDMAAVMEAHMSGRQFLVGDSVPVADFVAAYTLDWANEVHLLDASPQLRGYMDRMYARPKAPLRIAEALASIRA